MTWADGGLATEYWKQYDTADDVEELTACTTTMYVSGTYPIHPRLALQRGPAPTVVLAHGIFLYGTIFGRVILAFARAGFNVVRFGLRGFGQSGGPRGGTTRNEMLQAWHDVLGLARHVPPVPFEVCRTPVQVVVSERHAHWCPERMRRELARLGGPKELVNLEGRPHWELNREFQELICSHAIRWFRQHGAQLPVEARA